MKNTCPICNNSIAYSVCTHCGYEQSFDCFKYPTFSEAVENNRRRFDSCRRSSGNSPVKSQPEVLSAPTDSTSAARVSSDDTPSPYTPPKKPFRFVPVALLAVFVVLVSFIIFKPSDASTQRQTDYGNGNEAQNALYLNLIEEYEQKYGALSFTTVDEMRSSDGAYWTTNARGLCYTNLLDFDKDGSDELLLMYNNDPEGHATPGTYTIEVWTYSAGESSIICIYKSDAFVVGAEGISLAYYIDYDRIYILQCNLSNDGQLEFYRLEDNAFVFDHRVDEPCMSYVCEQVGDTWSFENEYGLSVISVIAGDYSHILSNSITRVKQLLG